MFIKPSYAKHTITIDGDLVGTENQAVDSPCEVVAVLATATSTALFVRLYDSALGSDAVADRKVAIAANTGESTPFTPSQPMNFEKGVYVVFEQGGGGAGGEITLVINK